MFKKLVIAAFLAASLTGCAPFGYRLDSQPVTIQPYTDTYAMRGSVWQIRSGLGRASVVVISSEYALTAGHVVAGQKTAIMTDSIGNSQEVEVVKYNEDKEIALLRGAFYGPYAKIAKAAPAQDEIVYTVGWPLDDQVHLQVLTVGHFQGYIDADFMLVTASVVFGNSGGGVFNAQGELIGLTVGIANGAGTPVFYLQYVARLDTLQDYVANL